MAPQKQYWLMKSEPNVYSIDDLKRDRSVYWSGVRNYQARNFMRDRMQIDDGVLFYHSNVEPIGIAGRAEVIKTGYPDHTAWNPKDKYYDAKSLSTRPIWFMVDIRFVQACREVITLERLKEIPALKAMAVLRKGNRLSITPVTSDEWEVIMRLPEWS